MYSPHSLTHPLTQRYNWKLRITIDALVPGSLHRSLGELSKTLSPGYMFVQEMGKKTGKAHIHGGFSFNSPRPDTVKKELKKYFLFDTQIKKLTNKHWSCVLDDEPDTWNRYFQYMMKEENVLATSYSKDELNVFSIACKDEWKRIQQTQRSAINLNMKAKSLDRETHFQNIIKKIKEDEKSSDPDQEVEVDCEFLQPSTSTCAIPNYSRKLDEIIDYVLDEYEGSYFTVSQLEPLVNRLMCHLYPGYWKNQLHSKLKFRLISQN